MASIYGWIKLDRGIQKHWLWEDKPFTRATAWIDLLLTANHEDRKTLIDGHLELVKRGSLITSQTKLMVRWGWSKSKLRRFLDVLQSEQMIELKTDNKKTTINIVNYSDFQIRETAEKPQKNRRRTSESPQKDFKKTSEGLQKDTNKNYKNYKKDKEEKKEEAAEAENLPDGVIIMPDGTRDYSNVKREW